MLKTFEVPVPHDNKTGDVEYMENYIFKNQFWQKVSLRLVNYEYIFHIMQPYKIDYDENVAI